MDVLFIVYDLLGGSCLGFSLANEETCEAPKPKNQRKKNKK